MKIRILVLGDSEEIVSPLEKLLRPEKGEWELYFFSSGAEALEKLSLSDIDMIIVDMHLPNMESISILEKVKEKYPAVIRIVISGIKDRDLMLKATHYAHQFLTMPDDSAKLKATIEKICSLQNYIHNENITKLINSIKHLPGLPELYLRIEEEINKNNPSFKKIEELISKDIIMTVKILQLVNSAFFGLPVKIVNPLQAINFLGLGTIKSLLLMVHLFSSDGTNQYLNHQVSKLWEHSLKVAKLCKTIAVEETSEPKTVEMTYIGGLLHDLGKIVLWQVDGYFQDVEKIQAEYCITLTEAEYVLYKTSHAEIGGYLLGVWGLPESLTEIVSFHHHPSNSRPKVFGPLSIVHISDHILNAGVLDVQYLEDLKITDKVNYWRDYWQKEQARILMVENANPHN